VSRGASHVLTPIRSLVAVAPSGGEITYRKFSESDRELSWYQGKLTADEDRVFWSAKLKAERPGIEAWSRARSLLLAHGFRIVEEAP
jgi:hypothetical protein